MRVTMPIAMFEEWMGHEEPKTYTAKDIQSFWRWAYWNGWYYGELEEMWFKDDDDTKHTIEEVLKIWKEATK